MNKTLGAGLLAAVTAFSANSEICGNGGFYVGLNLGASFDKAYAKFDKNQITAESSALKNALVGKVASCNANIDNALNAIVSKDGVKAVAESVNKLIGTVMGLGADTAFPAVGDAVAGSLKAVLNADKADVKNSKMYKLVKLLCEYDSSLSSQKGFSVEPGKYEENKLDLATAVSNIIKNNGFESLKTAVAYGSTTTQDFGTAGQTIDVDDVAYNTDINPGFKAVSDLKPDGTNTKTYITTISENTAARTDVLNTYYNAVKSKFESSSDTKALFYNTTGENAKEYDRTTLDGATAITGAFDAYQTNLINKEFSELGVNDKGVASKRATGFLAEAVLGFDHRLGDCMIGVDLNVGMVAGGNAKIKDKKAAKGSEGVKAKREFYVSLMPRVGYLVTPQFEVFATFGGSLTRYKVDTSNMLNIFDNAGDFVSMAKAYNEKNPKDQISLTAYGQDATKVFKSHKKTKFIPVVGAGVRYEITPEMYATLAYNYSFKTKIVDAKKAGAEVKFQSHVIKAGIGFRF